MRCSVLPIAITAAGLLGFACGEGGPASGSPGTYALDSTGRSVSGAPVTMPGQDPAASRSETFDCPPVTAVRISELFGTTVNLLCTAVELCTQVEDDAVQPPQPAAPPTNPTGQRLEPKGWEPKDIWTHAGADPDKVNIPTHCWSELRAIAARAEQVEGDNACAIYQEILLYLGVHPECDGTLPVTSNFCLAELQRCFDDITAFVVATRCQQDMKAPPASCGTWFQESNDTPTPAPAGAGGASTGSATPSPGAAGSTKGG